MAIQRDSTYPGRWGTADADYPGGIPKNRTTPTSADGSYLEERLWKDTFGFMDAAIAQGDITRSDTPETATASDVLDGIKAVTAGQALTWLATRNYTHPVIVAGFDDELYVSKQDSGPATTVQDPTTDASNTYWELLADAIGGEGVAVIGQSDNLSGQYLTDSTASYEADEVVLKDSSGGSFLAESVSFAVDITTSGVNGLDTGSESSDTWYYIYAIYNGTTTNGLISASPTAPTLPAGYTYSALMGVVRNDSSSDFINFSQVGTSIEFTQRNVFNSVSGVATYTSVSLSSVVPPIAKTVSGRLGHNNTGTDSASQVASSSDGFGMQSLSGRSSTVSFDGYTFSFAFTNLQCPGQTIYWRTLNTAVNSHAMAVSAFTI